MTGTGLAERDSARRPIEFFSFTLLLVQSTNALLVPTLASNRHGPMLMAEPLTSAVGEWEMDLPSSDALGPVLRELGLNRVLAAVVARLAVKQSITMDADALTVVVKTSLSEETLVLPFDGACVTVPGITGGRAACVSSWLDDAKTQLETRQSLVIVESDSAASAAAASLDEEAFVTVRSLRDGGDSLVEACSLVRGGVMLPQPRAERVLRRRR